MTVPFAFLGEFLLLLLELGDLVGDICCAACFFGSERAAIWSTSFGIEMRCANSIRKFSSALAVDASSSVTYSFSFDFLFTTIRKEVFKINLTLFTSSSLSPVALNFKIN
jgi:hypothetical protein